VDAPAVGRAIVCRFALSLNLTAASTFGTLGRNLRLAWLPARKGDSVKLPAH
jgi:hypothetical protein